MRDSVQQDTPVPTSGQGLRVVRAPGDHPPPPDHEDYETVRKVAFKSIKKLIKRRRKS